MTVTDFIARCDAFAAKHNIERATASTIIFNDGKRLDALANGAGITVSRLERVIDRLTQLENGEVEVRRPAKLGSHEAAA